jgi:hypothetical protein
MKYIINSGIAFLNFFSDAASQQMQAACYGAATLWGSSYINLKQSCTEAFQSHQVSFAPAFKLPEAKIQLGHSAS